eukprot:CAMPEP_0172734004 /NCGR_PEP_ID=MMETSP1074-20121228/108808_1 /TAXON_ID=2916 /ORGANISM="Ceratium fusus, Strain PA161109" /LENGTH=66 /DNA_ID=CAMNT_0013562683 /DNA_START=67 /DNA_END=264 /DNA_ORIENTATION=-
MGGDAICRAAYNIISCCSDSTRGCQKVLHRAPDYLLLFLGHGCCRVRTKSGSVFFTTTGTSTAPAA